MTNGVFYLLRSCYGCTYIVCCRRLQVVYFLRRLTVVAVPVDSRVYIKSYLPHNVLRDLFLLSFLGVFGLTTVSYNSILCTEYAYTRANSIFITF